jgi:hypothetical protein
MAFPQSEIVSMEKKRISSSLRTGKGNPSEYWRTTEVCQ